MEVQPCRKAQIVRRACKEMGLLAAWDASQVSESEYIIVWVDSDDGRWGLTKWVRFSDHVLPDQYKGNLYDYPENNFEVAHACGHEEVDGDCYRAIEWIAHSFERPIPVWVPTKPQ